MKWVSWCNYRRVKGAWGRFMFRDKIYSKLFSGKNKEILMEKALDWVINEKRRLGQSLVTRKIKFKYKRKFSKLPLGITINRDSRRPNGRSISAYANVVPWKQYKRNWSIKKYGYRKAMSMAINQRRKWMEEILNDPSL